MRDYRIFTKNNMINKDVRKGSDYHNLQFLKKETGDFYVIYFKLLGQESSAVIRIKKDGYIFSPERGTYVKHKGKYIVCINSPIRWYK